MTTIDSQGNIHDRTGQFAEKQNAAPAGDLSRAFGSDAQWAPGGRPDTVDDYFDRVKEARARIATAAPLLKRTKRYDRLLLRDMATGWLVDRTDAELIEQHGGGWVGRRAMRSSIARTEALGLTRLCEVDGRLVRRPTFTGTAIAHGWDEHDARCPEAMYALNREKEATR